MSIDQIKDSQRIVGLSAIKTVRYTAQITLQENAIWYSPIFDCDGLSIYGFFVFNHSGSPGSLGLSRMEFSPNSDFTTPPAVAYYALTPPGASSAVLTSQPCIVLGRYSRLAVKAGSSPGTYTVSAYVTFTP